MKLKTLIPKSEVRRLVVQRRNELSPAELSAKTNKIIDRLASTDYFRYANTVHTYIASRPGEVDTRRLINYMEGCGKAVVVPKLNKKAGTFQRSNFMGWDKVVKNSEGYFEPQVGMDEDLSDIDLIIVPALAVSITGLRIGYGGGYYDKLLKHTWSPKIVLAFEFQIFENIEADIHDTRVDRIITERRIITTREQLHSTAELL